MDHFSQIGVKTNTIFERTILKKKDSTNSSSTFAPLFPGNSLEATFKVGEKHPAPHASPPMLQAS